MKMVLKLLTRQYPLGFDISTLLLRLVFGGFMAIGHGWGKFQMLINGDHANFPDPLGIGSFLSLAGAALSEFIAGLMVAAGLLTRPALLSLIFTMLVAAFVHHFNDPIFGRGPSKELALLFLAAYISLFVTGPGRFSADSFIAAKTS